MKDLQAVFTQAVMLHQQGSLAEAEAKYREVLQVLPENVNILGNMGIVCRDLGRIEEAADYCQRAVHAAPDDPTQYINLGAVYEAQDRFEAARQCYEQALSLAPAHPKALNNLGKLTYLLGDSTRALELLNRAIGLEPGYPVALNNIGVILSDLGDTRGAVSHIERSILLDPHNIESLYNISGLYNCLGETGKARSMLCRLLALQPGHASARHMLAAIDGVTTETAPARYVAETFNKYASRFDRHIQESLGYAVPTVLAEMVRRTRPGVRFASGLDLGCGTGLSGSAFAELAASLTGVDLSSKMLARALEKKIYSRLECQDIHHFLCAEADNYDLVISADVLIYLGRLDPVFSGIAELAQPGAVMACSIERLTGPDGYALKNSGRYAHSPDYLVAQADSAGFSVLAHQEHPIRKENGNWIPGDLFLLERDS